MSALRQSLQDYLALRRGLGFKRHARGQRLQDVVSFLEVPQAEFVTTALALAWAQQPQSADPAWWAQRVGFVRGFARYCSAIDPRTEIPPAALLPVHGKRAKPYLYTEEDINQLRQAALAQPQQQGSQGWTYYGLLGLVAVSGLRMGEALALSLDDVDFDEGLLTIRAAKFGKSRWVPLHASTQGVLAEYLDRRRRALAGHPTNTLFVNVRGNPLDFGQVRRVFYRWSRQVGLRAHGASHGPRIYDVRHRFARLTLLPWYRDGQDVERRLPVLSAYLGPVPPSDTYWYRSATADLLGIAKTRLEDYWEQRS